MATVAHLDFERAIADVEEQIARLRTLARERGLDVSAELRSLERKLVELKQDTFRNLSPIERVQVARHPRRPYTLDYAELIFADYVELHGDRMYRDDDSIVGGWARLDGETVMLIGQQKGRDMKENLKRNFGMPHPEGYRKALRLMKLAEKFGRPVVTLIDTPGAYPGLGAEERGQAEAIARNLREMAGLRVPTVAVVIGEGGSGGALAIGVADRVLMLENAVYSVISPEGCAAILWKSGTERDKAAAALRITAPDLKRLGVIDDIVREPAGGAHSDWETTADALRDALVRHLAELRAVPVDELRPARWEKYMSMGEWRTVR
ncbi:MAG TPA: acetyl-CoA carboxylase carboxyltransferase subunit alpha [Longimicrobiaceae bacterium]|nr:acetyl-CoA carboxylase carboxyltransferase subunit alpha [Longimicrobiaceae bacterium]